MRSLCLAVLLGLVARALSAAEPVAVVVDLSRSAGTIRPLHGINKGPVAAGGTIELTERFKELRPPQVRLHDCQWPYPDVVDIHAVFRNPDADTRAAANYDFKLTDEYLRVVAGTGARMVYRLGESIEHGNVKRFVHPPKDVNRWAEVCLGIIRHYNEGWADGFKYGIPYWEIWNEPENRPAMWSGTDEDYLRLYGAAAKRIKSQYPQLKVGGPALGYSGKFEAGVFVPSEFTVKFLKFCRSESIPLDFFSWHCYTVDPAELVARAKGIRRVLDDHGFTRTESHLNEWNFLPGNSWAGLEKATAPEVRQRFYQDMGGPVGAAFLASALIQLQDAPLDVGNFYHAELGGFGLFNEFGVPNHAFYALRAFGQLASGTKRLHSEIMPSESLAVLAASGAGGQAGILISNTGSTPATLALQLRGLPSSGAYQVHVIDQQGKWTVRGQGELKGPEQKLELLMESPAVLFVEVR